MTIEIKICMGSACFARGNADNLKFIEDYIKENDLNAKVELYGARCKNLCEKGPNIEIDGTIYYEMNPERIVEVLRKLS